MTTFVRVWNVAYETNPADTQDVSQGATRIRELKVDLRERIGIDHIYADGVAAPNSEDGYHKQVTLKKGSDPSVPANYGAVYVKDHNNGTNTEPELHWKDDTGNVLRLTQRGLHSLLLSNNNWQAGQYTAEISMGTGSGNIGPPDAALSNAFSRTINGASTLRPPTNGSLGQILTIRVGQSGGPHAISVTGQGFFGSPDLDYTSAFPGETLFTLYGRGGANWNILAISRNYASAV